MVVRKHTAATPFDHLSCLDRLSELEQIPRNKKSSGAEKGGVGNMSLRAVLKRVILVLGTLFGTDYL